MSGETGSVFVKGGTVVNADRSVKADVLCVDGVIKEVGPNLTAPDGVKVVDATGKLVMPGGIDPHTHFNLPFMGTTAADDFGSGSEAALAGGTTMVIDFVIPNPGQSLIKAYDQWREWGKKASIDFSFHCAVTWWSEQVKEEMGILARERGINSFKHFLAYKGALMLDDEALVNSFTRAKELGALSTVHAENGELVLLGQNKMLAKGVNGPEGHPQSRPLECEAEAANRAARIAQIINTPLYLVHCSCKETVDVIARARGEGQVIYGEALAQQTVLDDSVYLNEDWYKAAAHVMSPPFRPKGNPEALWRGLQSGFLQTTASDHCVFCEEQKSMGRDDFTKIPNGTAGVEERMMLLWHHGVNEGKISANEFVKITSSNCATIFNLYPRKGLVAAGADADIVVWDPEKEHTFSQKTHKSRLDINIFEGKTVKGAPSTVVSRGRVAVQDGKVLVKTGTGRYLDRPCYGPPFDTISTKDSNSEPVNVKRQKTSK